MIVLENNLQVYLIEGIVKMKVNSISSYLKLELYPLPVR